MLLATSRFRVVNGTESAVREAFVNRPRHVDDVPGFLGMEVFEDSADPCTFFLMTRWTDATTFRAWHTSDDHRLSHAGIPKGIKLDPAFTKVVALDRIDSESGPALLEQLAADHSPLLAHFLSDSRSLHVFVLDRDGTIRASSTAAETSLRFGKTELAGQRLWPFLITPDAQSLRTRVTLGDRHAGERFLLNFTSATYEPYTLSCRLDVQPDMALLIGEPAEGRINYFEEMIELNNELATSTRENARQARALASTLAQLREAQAMLVHREKLVALGIMSAGIAHEINTPVGFVLNNHATLARDLEDLLGVVGAIQEVSPLLKAASPAAYAKISAAMEDADVDYLASSIPKKLASNVDGLQRLQQIILDMRTFSRLDEDGFKAVDVGETIAATVRMLTPLLREHDVSVHVDAAGLPPLVCAPGPFNQAVNNLLMNAVQASPPGSQVRVRVHADGSDCVVEILDTGCGIPPDHLPRVFDAFFTTKSVGDGTGLGLSIVHQVVTAHQGRIDVESVVGTGTTFRMRVPFSPAVQSQ